MILLSPLILVLIPLAVLSLHLLIDRYITMFQFSSYTSVKCIYPTKGGKILIVSTNHKYPMQNNQFKNMNGNYLLMYTEIICIIVFKSNVLLYFTYICYIIYHLLNFSSDIYIYICTIYIVSMLLYGWLLICMLNYIISEIKTKILRFCNTHIILLLNRYFKLLGLPFRNNIVHWQSLYWRKL